MEDIGIADNRRVQGLGSQQQQALLEARVPLGVTSPRPGTRRSSSSCPAPAGSARARSSTPSSRRDPRLWLSRSWTTRAQRPGEPDTRVRVHRPRRSSSSASPPAGSSSGPSSSATTTARPTPSRRPGADVVLEIEVDGARQVKALRPDALLIFVLPPSRDGAGAPPARPRRPSRQGRRPAAQGRGRGADRAGARRPRRRQRRPRRRPSTRCWRSSTTARPRIT